MTFDDLDWKWQAGKRKWPGIYCKVAVSLKEPPQAIYSVPSLGPVLALRRKRGKSNSHPQHPMYYSMVIASPVVCPLAPCPEDPREPGTGRQRYLQKFRPEFRLGRRFVLFFCLRM